jgi:hypothetical protein
MVKETHADRNQRLRDALRENLKRRKAQAKGRAVATDPPVDDASPDQDETARSPGRAGPRRSP